MKNIFCIILIFLLCACTSTEKEENIPYVKVEKITPITTDDNKIYQGYVRKGLDVDLSFNVSGIIKARYVIEGDFAKKGKLLIELDDEEYKLKIERAKLALNDAKVKQERAKSYYERISKLYEAGGISYNDWEEAKTNLTSNTNQIEILNDSLLITKKQENYTKIYAPYDGYVIKTYKDPYQYAGAGEAVIYFQGDKDIEGKIFVSESDITSIKENEEVEIKLSSNNEKTYKGKIKSKINSSLNKGSYEVKILIEDKEGELLDGMSINAKIKKTSANNKILVPISSVINDGKENYIFILQKEDEEKGRVLKRKVKTGDIIENKIEIKEVVKEGEFIIVEGTDSIMDGMIVNYL